VHGPEEMCPFHSSDMELYDQCSGQCSSTASVWGNRLAGGFHVELGKALQLLSTFLDSFLGYSAPVDVGGQLQEKAAINRLLKGPIYIEVAGGSFHSKKSCSQLTKKGRQAAYSFI
jgi:hypothetical protein